MNPCRYMLLPALLVCACLTSAYAQEYVTSPMNGPFGGPGTNMISTPSGDPLVAIAVGGMWTSTDGGWNWHTLNGGLDARVPTRLLNDPVNGDAYGVMNDGALYRLNESTGQWGMAGALPAPDAHCFRHTDGLFYAVDPGNAVYTSSNGTDWDVLYTGSTYTKPLSFVPAPNGMLFIGTDFNGVYRSTDNGGTWLQCFELTAEVRKLFISPGDTIYATTNFGHFGSGDWGETWIRDAKYPAQDSSIYIYPDGHKVYYNDNRGFYIDLTGDSGMQLTRAVLHGDDIRGLYMLSEDTLAAATGRGTFITGDGGEHWLPYETESYAGAGYNKIVPLPDGTLYSVIDDGSYNFRFIRSNDGGRTWSDVASNPPNTIKWDWSVSDEGSIAFVFHDSVWVTTDEGTTWKSEHLHYPGHSITFGANERLIIGTQYTDPPDDHYDSMYVSDDYGVTIRAVANLATGINELCHYGSYIFNSYVRQYSSDNGDTWQENGDDFGGLIDKVFSTHAAPDGGLFFCTNAGLIHCGAIDDPASFTRIASGSMNCVLAKDMEAIYTGTKGDGVNLSVRGTTTVTDPPTPASAHISSVYPNPVISSATVNYTLQAQSSISLRLVDVLGRTIATIEEGAHAPGTHTATLNTAALKPGTYFLRLEAPSGVQVKPVAVVR